MIENFKIFQKYIQQRLPLKDLLGAKSVIQKKSLLMEAYDMRCLRATGTPSLNKLSNMFNFTELNMVLSSPLPKTIDILFRKLCLHVCYYHRLTENQFGNFNLDILELDIGYWKWLFVVSSIELLAINPFPWRCKIFFGVSQNVPPSEFYVLAQKFSTGNLFTKLHIPKNV